MRAPKSAEQSESAGASELDQDYAEAVTSSKASRHKKQRRRLVLDFDNASPDDPENQTEHALEETLRRFERFP